MRDSRKVGEIRWLKVTERQQSMRGTWLINEQIYDSSRKSRGIIRAMHTRRTAVGRGKHRLDSLVIRIGEDIVVVVGGGEAPHVGSVAVAVPAEQARGTKRGATVSVFTVTGHKDDAVAVPIARRVAEATNRISSVVAGIHVHKATRRDIGLVLRNAKTLSSRIEELAQESL